MNVAYPAMVAIFNAFRHSPAPAYHHLAGDLSYQALFDNAATLAMTLRQLGREPIIIYGHKNRAYLVAYWACILAGRTVIPVESDNHRSRVAAIATQSGATLALNTTQAPLGDSVTIPVHPVPLETTLCSQEREHVAQHWQTTEPSFNDEDTMYMMFSSGTTGRPKGILVSYGNTVDFIKWLNDAFSLNGTISGNIRYCFDVSLYELWLAWLYVQPISSLDHSEMINTRKAIQRHRQHGTTTWVSTPSMTAYYLKDRQFDADSLPQLSRFIFCGEVLSKSLISELRNKFPEAAVINTYGPTECTVAVTCVEIRDHHITDARPLPIGQARPNSHIIIDPHTQEIIIQGSSVGNGYLGAGPEQEQRFVALDNPRTRRYHTGDLGYLDHDTLYFLGRADREIKVQGHRIDLNVIEQALHTLPDVEEAFVTPWVRKGQIQALRAFIKFTPQSSLARCAQALSAHLPPYMVPKFWYPMETCQLNLNSKLDRHAVAEAALTQGECFVFQYDSVYC
ncbi:TPA: AMP-binding protein [Aeromonas hydrophila]